MVLTIRKQMLIMQGWLALLSILIIVLFVISLTQNNPQVIVKEPEPVQNNEDRVILSIKGTQPTIMGKGTNGSPFIYDGSKAEKATGFITVKLDEEKNEGEISARITADDGTIYEVVFTDFYGGEQYKQGGVLRNGRLFGDTGNGQTFLPGVVAYQAAWGDARLTENGNLIQDPVSNADVMEAFFMLSDGVVEDDRKIYNLDKSAPYDINNPSSGYVDKDDREMHLIVHSVDEAPYQFFQHFVFEDVQA